MQRRVLGSTDLALSTAGLGTGGFPGRPGVEPASSEEVVRTLLAGLGRGCNWIECCYSYGRGVAEQLVGNALREWKDEAFLVGRHAPQHDIHRRVTFSFSTAALVKACEDSLLRLRVEVIDLYLLPAPRSMEELAEGYEALLLLKKQGKIRWPGVCGLTAEQLAAVIDREPPAAAVYRYNVLEREIEEAIRPALDGAEVPLLSYGALCGGILTDRTTEEWFTSLPEEHWALEAPICAGPQRGPLLRLLARLRETNMQRSLAALAVAWLQSRAQFGFIVSPRSVSQLHELLDAAEAELSWPEQEIIEEAYRDWLKKLPGTAAALYG